MLRFIIITLAIQYVYAISALGGSFGSGFLISNSGHIVTCEHCVPEGSRIAVLTQDGLSLEAIVVFRDKDLDLACLKIEATTKSFFPIGDSEGLKILDDIYVFGFPLPSSIGSELSASKGTLNAIRNHGGLQLLQVDAPVNPGNSGGPILDGGGDVVGVAVSKLDPLKSIERLGTIPERINFAVPSSVLRAELKKHGVAFASSGDRKDFEELRILASAATVQIIAAQSSTTGGEAGFSPGRVDKSLTDATIQAAAAYVQLGNSADLDSELSIYAPKVDYYDRGQQDLAYIRKDLTSLRKRWPERYYVVTSIDQVGVEAETKIGTATVHFRFALFKGEKFYKGEANTLLIFDLSTVDPKAIMVREYKTKKQKG